ncbi:hypothetical protein [Stackebrandtia albiflava]|uniref:hypothetical protein n=1 Tax=Stackebrandtia albiflava TaxID=406432 RepID=UPI0011BDBC63|nr:hypothetical protein [Stackebrandtia albiflava]
MTARNRDRWRVGRRRTLWRPRTPTLLKVLLHLGDAPELGLIAVGLALPIAVWLAICWLLALLTMPLTGLFELLGWRNRRVVVYNLDSDYRQRHREWFFPAESAAHARWLRDDLGRRLQAGELQPHLT